MGARTQGCRADPGVPPPPRAMPPPRAPVALGADEEAAAELGARRARVEQRGAGVREPALAQQVVGAHRRLEVAHMDAHWKRGEGRGSIVMSGRRPIWALRWPASTAREPPATPDRQAAAAEPRRGRQPPAPHSGRTRDAHQHVLGPLDDLAVQPQQVGALQRLRRQAGRRARDTESGPHARAPATKARYPASPADKQTASTQRQSRHASTTTST